jgi:hypothetical protein
MEGTSMTAALNAGREGMAGAVSRMTQAASVLSREVDVGAMIDLKLADVQARASAVVVRSVDESLGTLLDDLA